MRDPHVSGSWGFCPWKLLLGQDCPGCGGLRAVHLLTDGDVAGAASSNLLLVVAIPIAIVVWILWIRAAAQGRKLLPNGPSALWFAGGLAVAAVFTVVRNLPAGAWLAS